MKDAIKTEARKFENVRVRNPKTKVDVVGLYAGLAIIEVHEDLPDQGLKRGTYIGVGSVIIDGPYFPVREEFNRLREKTLQHWVFKKEIPDEEEWKEVEAATEARLKERLVSEEREEKIITAEEVIIGRFEKEREFQTFIAITAATNNIMQILKEERRLNEKAGTEDDTRVDSESGDTGTILSRGGSDELEAE